MTVTIYEASVPVCLRMLTALTAIIAKAEAHAAETGVDPKALAAAQLAPDMYGFHRQIQLATDHAKGLTARLAGREVPGYPDTETTFPELQARLAKTIDFISSIEVAELDGAEDRPITVKTPNRTFEFVGRQYLFHFAMPNFFFHVTTAYAILRAQGVPVGKRDYMGA